MNLWVRIKDFPNYQISPEGEILANGRFIKNQWGSFQFKKERIIKGYKKTNDYIGCILTKNSKKHDLLIHRLIAITYIPNPENKACINHINGIKDDNRIENLEWVSYKENAAHAFKTGLRNLPTGENHPYAIRKVKGDFSKRKSRTK